MVQEAQTEGAELTNFCHESKRATILSTSNISALLTAAGLPKLHRCAGFCISINIPLAGRDLVKVR